MTASPFNGTYEIEQAEIKMDIIDNKEWPVKLVSQAAITILALKTATGTKLDLRRMRQDSSKRINGPYRPVGNYEVNSAVDGLTSCETVLPGAVCDHPTLPS